MLNRALSSCTCEHARLPTCDLLEMLVKLIACGALLVELSTCEAFDEFGDGVGKPVGVAVGKSDGASVGL